MRRYISTIYIIAAVALIVIFGLIGREVIATLVVRELDGGGEVNRVDRVKGITNYELRITN